MVLILGIITAIVLFLVGRKVANVIVGASLRMGIPDNRIVLLSLKCLVVGAVMMLPFWPRIIIHYYQKATMPFVCDEMAGFKFHASDKFTSFLNRSDHGYFKGREQPYDFLVLKDVEFTEWVREDVDYDDWRSNFDLGIYRFKFYDVGARECQSLDGISSFPNGTINVVRDFYGRYGYSVQDIEGKCIGVEKVSEIKAEYAIDMENYRGVQSGFGYDVYGEVVTVSSVLSDEIVAQFKTVNSWSEEPITGFLPPNRRSVKSCLPYLELNTLHNKNLNEANLRNKFILIKGFFELNNME